MEDPRDRSEASRAQTQASLDPQQPSMGLEIWRILNASRIMFDGLGLVDDATQIFKNTGAIDSCLLSSQRGSYREHFTTLV